MYRKQYVYQPTPYVYTKTLPKVVSYNYAAPTAAPVQQIPIPQSPPVIYRKRLVYTPITLRKQVRQRWIEHIFAEFSIENWSFCFTFYFCFELFIFFSLFFKFIFRIKRFTERIFTIAFVLRAFISLHFSIEAIFLLSHLILCHFVLLFTIQRYRLTIIVSQQISSI